LTHLDDRAKMSDQSVIYTNIEKENYGSQTQSRKKSAIGNHQRGPEVLQIVKNDLHPPGTGKARIKILAAPVCAPDITTRYGLSPFIPKPPFGPGYAFIGVVDAIGDRVAALTAYGSYAEYIEWDAKGLIPVPASLDPAEAVPLILMTVLIFILLVAACGLLSIQAAGNLENASQSKLGTIVAIHKVFPYLAGCIITDTTRCFMSKDHVIKTQGLTKSYGNVQALFGVDLEVKQGEVFGFLGPNGSGKTTTIRCMLDLIRPQGGTISVLGLNPQAEPEAIKARVGYLPGELHVDENMTARQVFRFFNRLRGNRSNWDFIEELSERLKLELRSPIKNFSKGNKQKIGVVQALMHKPELLLLDEPTGSLDPLMQQEVLRMLAEAQDNGATVFFSSHIISEVQAIADRVAIIREGKIVEVAVTADLLNRSMRQVRIRFQQPTEADELYKLPGVELLAKDDGLGVLLQVEGEMDALIKTLLFLTQFTRCDHWLGDWPGCPGSHDGFLIRHDCQQWRSDGSLRRSAARIRRTLRFRSYEYPDRLARCRVLLLCAPDHRFVCYRGGRQPAGP
jgi:ABC-2 type transport system ATP-binding protein